MPYCSKCGTELSGGAAFCPSCGQAQAGAAQTTPTSSSTQTGMAENVAGLLCYVVGWVTGIIFLLIDKRPFVRFHAAQSIVVFGGLQILNILIGMSFGFGFMGGWGMHGAWGVFGLLYSLVGIAAFILWILLMVKAYQGEKFQVPIAGALAQNLFK
jgi:uncharacterized membrane protein